MLERRGTRLIVEALFLAALAAALAFARLDEFEIAGLMLVGWVVVAVGEWAAWRSEPHYGSGLPPRYYVPAVDLPPPQPLEQVERGYPGASREEAPTWIASAALRAEVLGVWPMATVPADDEEEEADDDEDDAFVPETDDGADPWTVAELPGEPEPDEEPQPVAVARVPVPAGVRSARYTLDPLAEPPPRRRFRGRGEVEEPATLEVVARPNGRRPLPGAAARA